MTGAVRKVLMESPEKFDPRDWLKPARAAMKQVCIDRMTAFGQAGHAGKIKSGEPRGDGEALRGLKKEKKERTPRAWQARRRRLRCSPNLLGLSLRPPPCR